MTVFAIEYDGQELTKRVEDCEGESTLRIQLWEIQNKRIGGITKWAVFM